MVNPGLDRDELGGGRVCAWTAFLVDVFGRATANLAVDGAMIHHERFFCLWLAIDNFAVHNRGVFEVGPIWANVGIEAGREMDRFDFDLAFEVLHGLLS